MSRAPAPDDERGLTLIELLVSITILGIVMVVLTMAVIFGLGATKNANGSLDESNAAQFTALYFSRDVQGAEQVSVDDATSTCGGAAELKLTSTTADRVVAYAVTGSPLQLVRRVCSPASATPTVTILVPSLSAAGDVAASVSGTRVTLDVNQPATETDTGFNFTLAASSRISP